MLNFAAILFPELRIECLSQPDTPNVRDRLKLSPPA